MKERMIKSCCIIMLSAAFFLTGCGQDANLSSVDMSSEPVSVEEENTVHLGDVPIYIGMTVNEVRMILGNEDDLYDLHGAAALQFDTEGTVVGVENVLSDDVTGKEIVKYQEEWDAHNLGQSYTTKMTMDEVSDRISKDQGIDPVIEEDLSWSGYYTETPVLLDGYKIIYYWESEQSGKLSSHVEISEEESLDENDQYGDRDSNNENDQRNGKNESNQKEENLNKKDSDKSSNSEQSSNENGWDGFISNAEYSKYMESDQEPPQSYAIYDLDGDGNSEILLEAQDTGDSPFFFTWIFRKTNDGIEKICDDYGYNRYRFNPKRMEIVGSPETRPDLMLSYAPFYKMIDGKIEFLYTVGMDKTTEEDGGPYFKSDEENLEWIKEGEYEEYNSGIIDFEWNDL